MKNFTPPTLNAAYYPFGTPAAFDPAALTRTLTDALGATGLDAHRSTVKTVTDTIQRALRDAGLHAGTAAAGSDPMVIDVVAREVDASAPRVRTAASGAGGRTVGGLHVGNGGQRSYQVYVPAAAPAGPMPMVVMLHGCTQSPEDFAAGTRMNELAEKHGLLVVYPAQSKNANGSKCWNWYRSQDQVREGGEPALIAGIVADVTAIHEVDRRRIFVAGLSAGGAMAVILGQTHPELFAAVGVHSGLPYAAAHDMPSAFAAMSTDPRGAPARAATAPFVPTIVFHGDRDTTVNAGNGAEVVARALAGARADRDGTTLGSEVQQGASADGCRYTRTVYSDSAGRPRVEDWVVHGAGHAWSGGSDAGSYTAPMGPDASEAMLRFFLAQDPGKSAD